MKRANRGFTLVELLIAVTVLTLLVVLVARLVNSTAALTSSSTKRIDINAEVRPLFSRIGTDFAQMIKRSDVTYYVKISANPEAGNDLIAFFSTVDGYYPNTGVAAEVKQPQTTVISYRINAQYQLERMAKSLPFAGQASPTPTPSLVFGQANPIWSTFPTATDLTASPTPEPDASVVGADVFRFEYYYLVKVDGSPSISPWASMPQVNISDVAAIVVAVAIIDPNSKKLLALGEISPNANLKTVTDAMGDYAPSMGTAGLFTAPTTGWQSVLDTLAGSSSPLPTASRAGVRGIRLYQRIFPL